MSIFSTEYVGLQLNNPLIVSSSGLTNSPEKIKKLEEQGAGAVVLKSLFEEQINFETDKLLSYNDYPEAADYISNYARENSLSDYLKLTEETKKTCSIPVFASINCVSVSKWINFAKSIKDAGADGLELNMNILPTERNLKPHDQEMVYLKIVREVSELVKIPVVAKISYHFSNLLYFIDQLYANGAKGVVLFNRFYAPDIDIDKMKLVSSEVFSNPSDLRDSLRWVAIISSFIKDINISASTGVHDGKAFIKQLLAGAQTVQICSSVYKNGIDQIKEILEFTEEWLYRNGFSSLDSIRGLMSYKNIKDPGIYERTQFMKYFSSIE